MTLVLLSPKAIADHYGIDISRLRSLRRRGAFPLPDARIRAQLGWSPWRLDRFAVETWGWEKPGDYERCTDADTPDGYEADGTPRWWLVQPVRYLGIPDLTEAANLRSSALWSHYYKGKLPDPGVTIGHHNRIAGWSPAAAGAIAAEQGWDFDLARLSDTSDLAGAL